MKKLALTLFLASITLVQAQDRIKGNGIKSTLVKQTHDYDKVFVTGSFDVEFVAGKEGKITLEGEENIINQIEIEVKNDLLKIYFKENKSYTYNSEVKITVPFEKISEISFTGSGDFSTKDVIKAEFFEVKLTGSGDGIIEINAQNIKTSVTGSGDLKIKGNVEHLEAKVSGSGDLNCSNLETQNSICLVNGSGDIKVNCKKSLKAKVTGSGNISYKGKPEILEKLVTGSGDIDSF